MWGASSIQTAVSGQVGGLGSSADYSPASRGLGGLSQDIRGGAGGALPRAGSVWPEVTRASFLALEREGLKKDVLVHAG